MKIALALTRLCFASLSLCFVLSASAADEAVQQVVATVDGSKITQADIDAEFLIRSVPAGKQEQLRPVILNDLIERRLIAAFLDLRKAPVPDSELDAQVDLLKRAVEAGGQGSLADILAKRGLTEEQLRAQISLPLRWKAFVRRTVTDQELRDYFEARRVEFDGTRVHVRQIVIGVPAGADESAWMMAEATLNQVREMIGAGKQSFEDAARLHSTSPSGKQGGDLGFIGYRGRVPPEVADAAFALMPNELSNVVRSPFGVHLVQVIERKPGEYSLEDVREQVWEQKTRDFWNDQVAAVRKSATIEIR